MAFIRKILILLFLVPLLAACAVSPRQGADCVLQSSIRPGSDTEDFIIPDTVFFETDRSDLDDNALAILRRQKDALSHYPGISVTIEGHADERGTREYNLALGDRRAAAVRNFFIASGIDGRRIKIVSYGKEKPAIPGSDEASWAKNRRSVSVPDNQ
ncbi:peptidoglycan-associated lipoprotein Pal [Azospirillum sp. sgz302134]